MYFQKWLKLKKHSSRFINGDQIIFLINKKVNRKEKKSELKGYEK